MTGRPSRMIGVDFSGGQEAGRKIWIAVGRPHGGRLVFEACSRVTEVLGCGSGRDACLERLRACLGQQTDAAFGLDFPFGLPLAVRPFSSWQECLDFVGGFASPEAFRAACLRATDGRELKRVTDLECATPFSPYNLWIYRQTFYGIRELLGPLVHEGSASVLPFDKPESGKPWLLEICPASTLGREGLRLPYKGRGAERRVARARILQALEERLGVVVDDAIREVAMADDEGDALDSLLAAFATFRAVWGGAWLEVADEPHYRLEGRVYS